MDTAQRELSDQIDQATQRLLDRARVITEPDLRAPSLLPGWTRARVLAHVARGADAMRNLLAGVRTGQDRPAGASVEAHEASLKHTESLRPDELMAELADSAMALRTVARQLPDDRWQVPVRVPGLAPFPAAELLARRLVEVELHHCDLGAGYGPANGRPASPPWSSPSRCAPGARTGSATRISPSRGSGHPARPRPTGLVSGCRGAGSEQGEVRQAGETTGNRGWSISAPACSSASRSSNGGDVRQARGACLAPPTGSAATGSRRRPGWGTRGHRARSGSRRRWRHPAAARTAGCRSAAARPRYRAVRPGCPRGTSGPPYAGRCGASARDRGAMPATSSRQPSSGTGSTGIQALTPRPSTL